MNNRPFLAGTDWAQMMISYIAARGPTMALPPVEAAQTWYDAGVHTQTSSGNVGDDHFAKAIAHQILERAGM